MALGDDISQLDVELALLARREGSLRLRLGQALEAIGRGASFELGFSSIGAYALERCERSVRWAEAARCVARRMEELPVLRAALASGTLSWSKGEILGGVATRGTEAAWLEAAKGCTVRELRALVNALNVDVADGSDATRCDEQSADERPERRVNDERGAGEEEHEADEERCTLTCTVDQEESWLFEATRTLLEQLGARDGDAQTEALLAEAQETLLSAVPRDAFELVDLSGVDEAERRRREELARQREQAEVRCEARLRAALTASSAAAAPNEAVSNEAVSNEAVSNEAVSNEAVSNEAVSNEAVRGLLAFEGRTAADLDRTVREVCRAMASQEFELSQRLLWFHRAHGWRRLGYATESHYARERLGMSRSSLLARRGLALKLERLPAVASALREGRIGVEVAVQVVRVATAITESAWLEHARRRTLKHLREEVSAALVAVRISGDRECWPPAERVMEVFHDLERSVVSGLVVNGNGSGSGKGDAQETGAHAGSRYARAERDEKAGRYARAETDEKAERYARAERDEKAELDRDTNGIEGPEGAGNADGTWRVMLESLRRWLAGGVQMSAGATAGAARAASAGSRPARSHGRVELRLRMSRGLYDWWRALEACARRWLPRRVSWLRFLCLSMWRAHRHLLGAEVAYGGVYVRDRYRCSSPVCHRRDVTPHHIQFRSAGGSDEDSNVIAVCAWCHLLGIHGGRIRATGTAEQLRWELGSRAAPCVVVDGRERVAA